MIGKSCQEMIERMRLQMEQYRYLPGVQGMLESLKAQGYDMHVVRFPSLYIFSFVTGSRAGISNVPLVNTQIRNCWIYFLADRE